MEDAASKWAWEASTDIISLHLDKALTTVSEPAVPSEHLAEPLQMLGYPERWAAGLTRD